jgi:hypothetical protein
MTSPNAVLDFSGTPAILDAWALVVKSVSRFIDPGLNSSPGHSTSTVPTAPFIFKSLLNWIFTFNVTFSRPCTVALGGVL